MRDSPALTYSTYLELDGLLTLQKPRSAEHDEMLFIVIHQVYELWFKQMLHELDHLRGLMASGTVPRALATFKRVLTILKTLVAQIDVLETMTPLSFGSFRDRLESASGFQSRQFREFEIVLGARRAERIAHYRDRPDDHAALERRLAEPSLYDAFCALIAASGFPVPAEVRSRTGLEPAPESAAMRAVLIDVYRSESLLSEIAERMVDLDEGVQEWRYRHVKMVERTIGSKPGTGGSAGSDYLRTTLFRPLFPDLWAVRSEF